MQQLGVLKVTCSFIWRLTYQKKKLIKYWSYNAACTATHHCTPCGQLSWMLALVVLSIFSYTYYMVGHSCLSLLSTFQLRSSKTWPTSMLAAGMMGQLLLQDGKSATRLHFWNLHNIMLQKWIFLRVRLMCITTLHAVATSKKLQSTTDDKGCSDLSMRRILYSRLSFTPVPVTPMAGMHCGWLVWARADEWSILDWALTTGPHDIITLPSNGVMKHKHSNSTVALQPSLASVMRCSEETSPNADWVIYSLI